MSNNGGCRTKLLEPSQRGGLALEVLKRTRSADQGARDEGVGRNCVGGTGRDGQSMAYPGQACRALSTALAANLTRSPRTRRTLGLRNNHCCERQA